VPFINRALTALKRIFIVIGIAIAFSVGLIGAIVLSLHSSETTVPDIVGRDRAAAENAIIAAGLNFRVRATRAVSDTKPNTVLIQVPSSGVVVKVGQTVAVDISRPTKEGETAEPVALDNKNENKSEGENRNERASSNSNENKPRRNRNTNRNANDNSNANGNRNRNGNTNRASNNRNANANRTTNNSNSTNRPPANANRSSTSNANRRRPAASPTP
jgi:beta-lactam-binding protein with PASTA domain